MNVPEFVARLSEMVRGFTLGNVFIGLIMTVVTVGVLFALKLQGAIIIGVISGFLNLIPFVGLLLASVPVHPQPGPELQTKHRVLHPFFDRSFDRKIVNDRCGLTAPSGRFHRQPILQV